MFLIRFTNDSFLNDSQTALDRTPKHRILSIFHARIMGSTSVFRGASSSTAVGKRNRLSATLGARCLCSRHVAELAPESPLDCDLSLVRMTRNGATRAVK
jgi:hypothetical protein